MRTNKPVAPDNVIGSNSGKRRWSRKRLVAVVLIAVAILAVVAFFVYKAFFMTNSPTIDPSSKVPVDAQKMTEINGEKITETQRAEQAIYYGDYDKGQQILKEQAAAASSNDDKFNAYMELAANAYNAKNYADADTYAQEAVKIKKVMSPYSILMKSAAAQGNKSKAIEYANEVKNVLNSKERLPTYQQNIDEIDRFIAEQQK